MINDTQLQDGLVSMASNLGKRQAMVNYQLSGPRLTDKINELETLWAESWICQKVCNKRSRDMVRKWREVTSNDMTAEELEKIDRLERKLRLKETLEQALVWASLFGGIGLLVLTERNTVSSLTADQQIERLVLLRKEQICGKGSINQNLFDDNYGRYEYYSIDNKVDVHHSRLLILNAISRPLKHVVDTEIWGVSDLEPIYQALKRFDLINVNVGDLVTESKVDVLKVDGLTNKIASGLETQIAQMVEMVQLIKSSTNTLLLDKENDYEQKELTFSGLKDLLVEFRNSVAGAADMPVTILFGQSVSGLASGDEDIQNYHESIHSLQESRLRPIFDRIDPLIAMMALGRIPDDWWFEFVPLRELSTEQRITAFSTFAGAATSLIQAGVLTEVQVANELKENGLFANISAEDIEGMKNADELTGNFEEPEEMEDTQV